MHPECRFYLSDPQKTTQTETPGVSGAIGSLCRLLHSRKRIMGPRKDLLYIRIVDT